MRDRDQLKSLIKSFEVGDAAGERPDTKNVGLIGGDIGHIIKNLPPLLKARDVVDPFRDPGSVSRFLGLTTAATVVRLEIGSARGTFSVAMAARDPQSLFLACEVRSAHCRAILGKRDRRGLENLHVMLGDVRLQLPRLVAAGPIMDEIYILFPDPWWKKKHWKRRLFQPGFLEFLGTALKPDGRLVLKTDVAPYRDEVQRLGAECTGYERWEKEKEEEFLSSLPPSRREQELMEAGLDIHGLVFSRLDTALSPQSPDQEP